MATTTSLAVNPNPATAKHAVTLTASVTTGDGGSLPSGTSVTFDENGDLLAVVSLTSEGGGVYQASYVDSTGDLAQGTQSFTATFNSTGSYLASSDVVTDVFSTIATATTLTVSPQPPVTNGETLSLTATVSVGGGNALPTGSSITFSGDSGHWSAAVSLTEVSGSTYEAVTTFSTGSYEVFGSVTFTATYAGSMVSGIGSSSNQATDFVLYQVETTVSGPYEPTYGETATLTALLSPSGNSPPAVTGTESFYDGGELLGTGTITQTIALGGVTDYKATLASPDLPGGTSVVTAVFDGNSSYQSSTGAWTATVVAGDTTTTLSAEPDPATTGEGLTLTATVTTDGAALPSGSSISFSANGAGYLGAVSLTEVSAGMFEATYVDTSFAAGSLTFTASYHGSTGEFEFSSKTTTDFALYGVSTTLSASPNPATYLESVTLTATLSSSGSVGGGTESFYLGATLLGTATINTVGGQEEATLVTTALPTGNDLVSGVFNGNSTCGASTASYTETVSPAATSTTLTTSPNPSTAGESVTLTASVSGPGTVFGTVEFLDGAGGPRLQHAQRQRHATLVVSNLPAGSDSLTAVYEGNSDYLSSTSSAVDQVVDPLAGTGQVVVAGQDTSFSGTLASFTAPYGAIGNYSAIVRWGDGQTSTGSIVSNGSGGY